MEMALEIEIESVLMHKYLIPRAAFPSASWKLELGRAEIYLAYITFFVIILKTDFNNCFKY